MKSFRILALGLMVLSGVICASLSAAGSTYYLNDNLATTVGIADAAGEIAALEADAFGAPIAAGHAPSRYTGKPYDEDMGAYVFPFRNYRPEEGRWMSADPSGFPDGVNSRSSTAHPYTEVDPFGLKNLLWLALKSGTGPDGEIADLQILFNNQYSSMVASDNLPDNAYLDDGDKFDFVATTELSFLSGSTIGTYDVIYVVAHGILTSSGYNGYNINGTSYSESTIRSENSKIVLFDGCGSPAANGQITYASNVATRWFMPSREYLYDHQE